MCIERDYGWPRLGWTPTFRWLRCILLQGSSFSCIVSNINLGKAACWGSDSTCVNSTSCETTQEYFWGEDFAFVLITLLLTFSPWDWELIINQFFVREGQLTRCLIFYVLSSSCCPRQRSYRVCLGHVVTRAWLEFTYLTSGTKLGCPNEEAVSLDVPHNLKSRRNTSSTAESCLFKEIRAGLEKGNAPAGQPSV